MKRIICFGLMTLSISSAQAGYVCRTACSGVVDKVIDGTYSGTYGRDAGFEKKCNELGGTVKLGRSGDSFGFDDMGCWLPDNFTLYGKKYSYCVIKEKVQATGFGITAIPTRQGGSFTASDSAYESCRKNLSRSGCHRDHEVIEASDIVMDSANCNEIPD